jgi:hypothetical protein
LTCGIGPAAGDLAHDVALGQYARPPTAGIDDDHSADASLMQFDGRSRQSRGGVHYVHRAALVAQDVGDQHAVPPRLVLSVLRRCAWFRRKASLDERRSTTPRLRRVSPHPSPYPTC